MRDFRLYVILDTDVCKNSGKIVEIARQAILAKADILQLRAKSLTDRQILNIGQAIKRQVQRSSSLFVLNDRVDLSYIIGADGVHLGQEDLPIKDARKILGNNKIIGASTHSVEQAHQAEEQGADYIAIGPIFTTATKPNATPLSPEIIPRIKDKIKIPFLVVGGIGLHNLDLVLSLGARRAAICRAIIEAQDVVKATREFRQRLYE